jgi:hypothetical protein
MVLILSSLAITSRYLMQKVMSIHSPDSRLTIKALEMV